MLAFWSCLSTSTSASTLRTCSATGAATDCSLLSRIYRNLAHLRRTNNLLLGSSFSMGQLLLPIPRIPSTTFEFIPTTYRPLTVTQLSPFGCTFSSPSSSALQHSQFTYSHQSSISGMEHLFHCHEGAGDNIEAKNHFAKSPLSNAIATCPMYLLPFLAEGLVHRLDGSGPLQLCIGECHLALCTSSFCLKGRAD